MEAGSIKQEVLSILYFTAFIRPQLLISNNAASDTAKGLLRYAQVAGNMFLGYFLHKCRLFF